jgi:hypothetical protein
MNHLLEDMDAMNDFGRQLLSENREALQTFDQAAQAIVERVYRAFRARQARRSSPWCASFASRALIKCRAHGGRLLSLPTCC